MQPAARSRDSRRAWSRPDARRGHWRELLLLLTLVVSARGVQAEEGTRERPQIAALRVGFGQEQRYKVGVWTPATVTLRGGASPQSGTLELTVQDADQQAVRHRQSVNVPAGSDLDIDFLVRFGVLDCEATVIFISDEGERVQRAFSVAGADSAERLSPPLKSSQELIVSIGPSVGLSDVRRMNKLPNEGKIELAAVDSPEALARLPENWLGYEGVDILVLSTGDDPQSKQPLFSKLTALQAAAIVDWVHNGGRLVIFAGANCEAFLAEGNPLAAIAPARFAELTTLPRVDRIEEYVEDPGKKLSLPQDQVPRVTATDEDLIEVRQGNVPIVIRAPLGFGEIVLVAMDAHLPPLANWPSRGRFMNRVLGKPAGGSDAAEAQESSQRLNTTGVSDLAGQLRSALDQYEGVTLVPFLVVAALAFGYVLLIGPLDFLLVRRVFRRAELTWVTFPLMVLAVGLGAYFLTSYLKGNQLRVNQVELVDVDLPSGRVRLTSWFSVFSPQSRRFDVALRPELPSELQTAATAPPVVAWLGAPGDAVGGMDRDGAQGAAQDEYQTDAASGGLRSVPIPVWSSKTFVARWSAALASPAAAGLHVEVEIYGLNNTRLTITNQLPFDLRDCFISWEERALRVERLVAGERRVIDFASEAKGLGDELVKRRYVLEDDKGRTRLEKEEYDAAGFDVPGILRRMMFYAAAEGFRNTGLHHRHQAFTDVSRHIKQLRRGVVMGFADQPASQLTLGEDIALPSDDIRRWTCYRFVFDDNYKD